MVFDGRHMVGLVTSSVKSITSLYSYEVEVFLLKI